MLALLSAFNLEAMGDGAPSLHRNENYQPYVTIVVQAEASKSTRGAAQNVSQEPGRLGREHQDRWYRCKSVENQMIIGGWS